MLLNTVKHNSPGNEIQTFVARNVYPDAMGLPVDFSTQTTQSFNTVITLEDEYVFENCEVIVNIQNMDNKEIYQGTSKMMTEIVGVEDVEEFVELEVYPNPTSDMVNIRSGNEIQKISVYNSSGQMISETESHAKHYRLNTSELVNGIYYIKVETSADITTSKVSIVK